MGIGRPKGTNKAMDITLVSAAKVMTFLFLSILNDLRK